MQRKANLKWILTVSAAFLVVIISFTPVVVPKNTYQPQLFGMPYSLWMGLLVTILLVVLTYIATRVHPGGKEAKKKEKSESNKSRNT